MILQSSMDPLDPLLEPLQGKWELNLPSKGHHQPPDVCNQVMTITGDKLTALNCHAKPKPVHVNYRLSHNGGFADHFDVVENGTMVGTLLKQGPVVTLAINGQAKFDFRHKGTHDEHALAYGILFIIIVLSVAIYYTKF